MPDTALALESTITCPNCGHRATETMPTDACQYFYDCKGCGALLKPKSGNCCVFCSYGSVPCPPIQAGGGAPTCCAGDATAVEIRPGVQRPDWSIVTSAAARDALLARDRSRPGPVEAWTTALPQPQDAVWRAVIALFARLGRPPQWAEIAVEANLSERAVEEILSELERNDLLAVDKDRRSISYAYPFTARPSAHRISVHGHQLRALCAIDALGVGAMCDTDVVIESSCQLCGAAISIETARRGTTLWNVQPGDAVVWYDLDYDCCAATSCCPSIAFFCSDGHLENWRIAQARQPTGRRLMLADAFEIGRALFEPVLKPAAHDRHSVFGQSLRS